MIMIIKPESGLILKFRTTNSNFIKREIKDWKIQTASFEQTISGDFYAEGLINLKLPAGKYNFRPIITDQNSNNEILGIGNKFDSGKPEKGLENFNAEIESKVKFTPMIVDAKKIICNDKEYFRLTNFEGNIPFGPEDYSLIIPVHDLSLKQISITVISHNDTIIKKTLTDSFISSIGLEECSGKILITNSGNHKTNNFILSGISNKLREGPFSIIVNDDKEMRFHSFVFWYNKPLSLRNPELAIKALKYVEDDSVIDSLLDLDEKNMYKGLVDYWKKLDPSPETEYNELMTEYYSRVDYAQINFTSINGIKGIDSDRGKIYVKFGKPDQVERASNEQGKIVETWIYKKPASQIYFC